MDGIDAPLHANFLTSAEERSSLVMAPNWVELCSKCANCADGESMKPETVESRNPFSGSFCVSSSDLSSPRSAATCFTMRIPVVMPYSTSTQAIVFFECVTMMNCERSGTTAMQQPTPLKAV